MLTNPDKLSSRGSDVAHEYPRPQLRRAEWWNLNGRWDFQIDVEARWQRPESVEWDGQIEVPFAPETSASGVAETGFYRAVWYRREFSAPELKDGQRLILHFGAVDYRATVWVNNQLACVHIGGYTPFECDITELLSRHGRQVIVVRAEDDADDLTKPRGKQDWKLNPHSIWYQRTTGIWQTVWLERVPHTRIAMLRWTPNLHRWELDVAAILLGFIEPSLRLHVRLHVDDRDLANDVYAVIAGEVHRRIALSDPGIDDYRNELLWYPTSPRLIEAEVELRDRDGRVIDRVESYTALRSVGVQGDRLVLNGRPYYLRMALDQGLFPHTGLSAPDDESLRRDVELAKAMGFNGVRRHQTVSDPRYLYWADRLGLMVWSEMPSAYRFTTESVNRVVSEWMQVMQRDSSHPCIIAWVPFNESWGVPDLPDSPTQRHYVQSLYHLTRTLDPTRPVIGNDGWESIATDIIGIHDYDDRADEVAKRYGADEPSRLFRRERPGGRMLLIDGHPTTGQPVVLSEFGGISIAKPNDGSSWGYSVVRSARELHERYRALLGAIHASPMLAGFCYTQFADTYQETNGLLTADRTPKFAIEDIASITGGRHLQRDLQFQYEWRERLMDRQLQHYRIPPEDHQTQTT